MIVAYCPNCGKRYYGPADLVEGVRTEPDRHGCGDCAQGAVRPRDLYRLRLMDTERDTISGEAETEAEFQRFLDRSRALSPVDRMLPPTAVDNT